MTSLSLKKEDFSSFDYDGLVIQSLPNGKNLLILMSKDETSCTKFLDILKTHNFDLGVFINEETGQYTLDFNFIDTGLGVKISTGKTEISYPPIVNLKNNAIHYISTGIWQENSEHGRNFVYNHQLMRLGEFNIATSLENASHAQFYPPNPSGPAMVILTFQDFEQIQSEEADKAYNKLLDLEQARPTLEITTKPNGLIDLRIWDIVFELDIKIKDLKFSVGQLEAFVQNTYKKATFLFALGVNSEPERPNMVATRPGEPNFIRIYGYKYTSITDSIK